MGLLHSKRITSKTIDVNSTQFEDAMARYNEATLREIELKQLLENEVNELVSKYSQELDAIAQIKQASFGLAHTYCLLNKETLFDKRRSIGTLYGIAGFRLGTPRLKTLKGSNWSNILTALKEHLPAYIRTIEEPAKDLLLADRNKETVAPLLFSIGVQVVQDELFYIEPKKAA